MPELGSPDFLLYVLLFNVKCKLTTGFVRHCLVIPGDVSHRGRGYNFQFFMAWSYRSHLHLAIISFCCARTFHCLCSRVCLSCWPLPYDHVITASFALLVNNPNLFFSRLAATTDVSFSCYKFSFVYPSSGLRILFHVVLRSLQLFYVMAAFCRLRSCLSPACSDWVIESTLRFSHSYLCLAFSAFDQIFFVFPFKFFFFFAILHVS